MSEEVVIIRTGSANLASVVAAFGRIHCLTRITQDAATVASAARVVLPGVGAFGRAMEQLRANGLDAALKKRFQAGEATLAICLGLQLLAESSEESPGVAGLGVLPACVARFPDAERVPQLGWNSVEPDARCSLLRPGYAYFANAYRLTQCASDWSTGISDYGGPFVSAVERGAVLGCQFHPELSGRWGLDLLRRWVACVPSRAATC
jgi:imidazole glycerol phosphate synthase glutamine amidotransferase subunit